MQGKPTFPLILMTDLTIFIQITNQSEWDFVYTCRLIQSRKHALANYLTTLVEKNQNGSKLTIMTKVIDYFLRYLNLEVSNFRIR
jgi:hypothetical protein